MVNGYQIKVLRFQTEYNSYWILTDFFSTINFVWHSGTESIIHNWFLINGPGVSANLNHNLLNQLMTLMSFYKKKDNLKSQLFNYYDLITSSCTNNLHIYVILSSYNFLGNDIIHFFCWLYHITFLAKVPLNSTELTFSYLIIFTELVCVSLRADYAGLMCYEPYDNQMLYRLYPSVW